MHVMGKRVLRSDSILLAGGETGVNDTGPHFCVEHGAVGCQGSSLHGCQS